MDGGVIAAGAGAEEICQHLEALVFGVGLGIEDDVGLAGLLESAVPAGELLYLALGGFGIETFDVALLAGLEGGLHIDFYKILFANDLAGHAAEGAGGGDEGADDPRFTTSLAYNLQVLHQKHSM